MPHIIVEYEDKLAKSVDISAILQAIHHAIADSGLFKANQIKTRAYPFHDHTNAGSHNPYIHIQARIKSGRDADNKKQFAQIILAGLKQLSIPASVITVEVIDMDRASYGKFVPKINK